MPWLVKRAKPLAAAIVSLALISGCAQVREATESARAENAVREAAIKRIIVSTDSVIPDHPSFERLGTVGGHCAIDQDLEDYGSFAGSLRRSAYLKFGLAADAVIEARSWYTPYSVRSSIFDTSGRGGEFYCCGVAVHFTAERQ